MKIQLLKNKKGKWFWRLVARNGRILSHSESYSSKRKALRTADSVANALKVENVMFKEIEVLSK